METIKKFITVHIPVSACNFACHYCYISQLKLNDKKIDQFIVSPLEFRTFFSRENIGGIGYFNLCGNGETMLHPQLISLVKELTEEGHYVDIITNGTMTDRFKQLIKELSSEQQAHLFVKFSLHYIELKNKNLLKCFVDNVNRIKNSDISYSIEITPNDELIDFIDEIKEFSKKEFGALPHMTVGRNEATDDIELLTNLPRDGYKQIWQQFDSALFDFKFSIFNQERLEFCYAGDWSLEVDLLSGNYRQCYCGAILGNIKDDSHLNICAIGKCREPHCFNGHAFLAFGCIPELKTPTYCQERDRETYDGDHWLKESCRSFFSTRLMDSNKLYTSKEKEQSVKKTMFLLKTQRIRRRLKKLLVKFH